MAKRHSDMHGTVKCDRCGAKMKALDFNIHECVGKRSLQELPLPILRKVAMNEISEAEAWRLFDNTTTG